MKNKDYDYLNADELFGYFDIEEDKGDFILDIQLAREERSKEILIKSGVFK